jgi:CHAT domain-containing protein/tetratricopeptide (TPR) repeat protein
MARRSGTSVTLRRLVSTWASGILLANFAITTLAYAQQGEVASLIKRANELEKLGRYPEALASEQRLLSIREKLLGPHHPDVALSLNNLAVIYSHIEGKQADVEALYKRSLAIREQALGPQHLDVAFSIANLAVVYHNQARYADAEPLFKRALAIREKSLGPNHPDVAALLYNLAMLYVAEGRAGDAEPLVKRSLAIQESVLGRDHKDLVRPVSYLASIYFSQGRYADAALLYKRALTIQEKALGPNSPETSFFISTLAATYLKAGRYAEAETLYNRELAIKEKAQNRNQLSVSYPLSNLAIVYRHQGRFAEAESLYHRILPIYEGALGPDNREVAVLLNNVGLLYYAQRRYREAEAVLNRALAGGEKAFGTDRIDASILTTLANVYGEQGRYVEARALLERALSIREKTFGPDHPEFADMLVGMADLYFSEGRNANAELLFKRAMAIEEKTLGPEHPRVAVLFNDLANLYLQQKRYSEAELLYKRALGITDGPDIAASLTGLGSIYYYEGRYAEAEPLLKRALAISERTFGSDHVNLSFPLQALASVYDVEGRRENAEALFKRALAIREKALGPDNPQVASALSALALHYSTEKRFAEAEMLYRRTLAIREKAFGSDHPDVAETLDGLASVYALSHKPELALTYSRKASGSIIAHAEMESSFLQQKEKLNGLLEQRADYFRRHIVNLGVAIISHVEPESKLIREAFEVAQWGAQSDTAMALQQMAARFGAGSDALASLVRQSQDLSLEKRGKDKALLAAFLKPSGQQDRAENDALRNHIVDLDGRIATLAGRLERQFPEYAALSNPKPLVIDEVQRLLGKDEALAFFLVGDMESYVFAMTRENFDWRTIPIGATDLSAKIAAFRHGLDVNELSRSINAGKPILFDLGLAYELYTGLIGPIEAMVKDKPHLLVVPTGALTSLPFHLLVTEKPARPVPQVEEIATYRNAAWLIKRQAVTVLPSVASLQALRVFARKEQGTKPMVGFGDPVFDPTERAKAIAERRGKRAIAANTRGYSEFWQGAGVDRTRLAQALPSLLDTADELKAVAAKLGAPAADIHLDNDASETTVKHTALDGYRIVYFATHGLIAGDVKGLGEPSLALSLPAQPTELDDGLLTASEVAQLKLGADWVVLSACNTAAGDKPGAEALSGLARAFFYAGARALLVSHWSVASDAATRLTTSTFDIMNSNPTVGRAEALRRAMLAYMNDEREQLNAYPGFWGPFSVVGEGAAR